MLGTAASVALDALWGRRTIPHIYLDVHLEQHGSQCTVWGLGAPDDSTTVATIKATPSQHRQCNAECEA